MGGFAFTKNNKLFDYPIAEFLQQHTFYITTKAENTQQKKRSQKNMPHTKQKNLKMFITFAP